MWERWPWGRAGLVTDASIPASNGESRIMSKKAAYFDGTLGIDGFASTAMVGGAALLLFVGIVFGLVRFQQTSTDAVQAAHENVRIRAAAQSGTDIVGAAEPASK
jgi:hypothetical protein